MLLSRALELLDAKGKMNYSEL